MSLGPSDLTTVVTLAKNLYHSCKDVGGEYDEVSGALRGLHTVLRHLKYEVEAPDSPLNHDHTIWKRKVSSIVGDCDSTMRQLDALLKKHSGSARSALGVSSSDMDRLDAIRAKLISHKTNLTLFLDTIQLQDAGEAPATFDNHEGQLDIILDKVDCIATRMGLKSRNLITNYDHDEEEVWKQFRKELVLEGFSSSVLQQHEDVLRAYIREIDQNGLLDGPPSDENRNSGLKRNSQRWLQNGRTESYPDAPPTFDSLNTPTSEDGAKEIAFQEENMKFSPSMKFERPQPETYKDLGSLQRLDVPTMSLAVAPAVAKSVKFQQSPIPVLKTPGDKIIRQRDSDSSSDDSETEYSFTRSKSPSKGDIIRTSDLLALSQALQIMPSSSPQSFRSQSSAGEEHAIRSIAYRPKEHVETSSPPGAIPIPSANSKDAPERFGTSPRPEISLAPDSYGNKIPLDAEWTKIARRLVSLEVLEQDRRRYEARPDFVAVLGRLSREEVEDYAIRSQILRATRSRRSNPSPRSSPNPHYPQRPPERRSGRDTPSTDEDDESSESEHYKRERRSKARRSHVSSSTPRSGYPNPFGSLAPPSPVSPSSSMAQPSWTEPAREKSNHHSHRNREKEREHSSRRHRSSSKQSHSSQSRNKNQQDEGRSRWRGHVASAGIGGAAAGLLTILAEAADGF